MRASSIDIHPNATWSKNGITVAGGHGRGSKTDQLYHPWGLYVDNDLTVYVADYRGHRIMEWKSGATNGTVVAEAKGPSNGINQFEFPVDVIIDKETDSLIISDLGNKRVVRWARRNGTRGDTIISNIFCWGLTMDDNGYLYVADIGKRKVRRYKIGDTQGKLVAGGNGKGERLDQLSEPHHVFVDREYSVYVSERGDHRVMKWEQGATQGIVVAGGQGKGNSLSQLNFPAGVVVDQLGTVYVADCNNHRIMRWPKGVTQGSAIIGGNGSGAQSNQLAYPTGLSFDRHGNLYVADHINHRKGFDLQGKNLLNFYVTSWEHYRFSSEVTNGFCYYLNRHWVRREYDTGRRDVYDIFTVMKVKVTQWIDEKLHRIQSYPPSSELSLLVKKKLEDIIIHDRLQLIYIKAKILSHD
ncbi:unnamed protein product [Rotaria sp. Silwood2]|nr:unnamed protein product [Rotaria sp. Silwood2]